MTTLDDTRAGAQTQYIADLLAPEEIRRSALGCIAGGTTAEVLRKYASIQLADLTPVWLAWADEIEMLTAHGVTGRPALEAAKLTLAAGNCSAADLRHAAALELWQATPRGDRLAMVADQMDALLAEGFDPAVYAKEIDQACGGAAAEQLLAERAASSLN